MNFKNKDDVKLFVNAQKPNLGGLSAEKLNSIKALIKEYGLEVELSDVLESINDILDERFIEDDLKNAETEETEINNPPPKFGF